MITLPDNWKDGIYIRKWVEPYNQFGETAMLVIILANEINQHWMYTQSVVIPGVEKLLSNKEELERIRHDREEKAYENLVNDLPLAAKEQDTAGWVKDRTWVEEPIQNDLWHIVRIPDLELYKT